MLKNKNDKELQRVISCGAAVIKKIDNAFHILLIKQLANKDSWGIPKGHINENESYTDCAIREVFEETGIKIVLCKRLPDCNTTYNNNSKNKIKTVITFLAHPLNDSDCIKLDNPNNEVADAQWFNVDFLPNIQSYQSEPIHHAIMSTRTSVPYDKTTLEEHDIVINDNIMSALKAVFEYASVIDDWIEIKKELLKLLKPIDRQFFSTRHPITKLQQTNEFEKLIAVKWSEMSGRTVLFR